MVPSAWALLCTSVVVAVNTTHQEEGRASEPSPRRLITRRLHRKPFPKAIASALLVVSSHADFPFKLPLPKSSVPPKPPILRPKPWRDAAMGKSINSVRPAGNSYPPLELRYAGSRYARRFFGDQDVMPIEVPEPTFPNRTNLQAVGGAPHVVFPQAFHVLPSAEFDKYQRERAQQDDSYKAPGNVGRLWGSAPVVVRTIEAE